MANKTVEELRTELKELAKSMKQDTQEWSI
jgi:hypothetical protein